MVKNQYNTNGKKDGYWEFNYANHDKLYSSGYYENDIRVGEWKYYYTNGQIWTSGYFNKDEYIGYWEEYDSRGNIIGVEYSII